MLSNGTICMILIFMILSIILILLRSFKYAFMKRFIFLYDINGLLYGFIYNKSKRYYYIRDILQNILGIIDSAGNIVVKYKYDAYGNILDIIGDVELGKRNPFKYKGYYYDNESEMYYCSSRYYVPLWCRWLNADSVSYLKFDEINGCNLYAYCNNNPVMYSDRSGHIPWWGKTLIGVGIITAIITVTVATGGANLGPTLMFVHTIAKGAAIGSIVSAAVGGIAGGVSYDENGLNWNLDNATTGFMLGSITGAISGAFNAGLGTASKLASKPYLVRGIMSVLDAVLGGGSYCAQNSINGTMANTSVTGAAISCIGGLFDFASPLNQYFDAFWCSAMASEIGWAFDTLWTAIQKKKLSDSF